MHGCTAVADRVAVMPGTLQQTGGNKLHEGVIVGDEYLARAMPDVGSE
jgi:hypothetical protein